MPRSSKLIYPGAFLCLGAFPAEALGPIAFYSMVFPGIALTALGYGFWIYDRK